MEATRQCARGWGPTRPVPGSHAARAGFPRGACQVPTRRVGTKVNLSDVGERRGNQALVCVPSRDGRRPSGRYRQR